MRYWRKHIMQWKNAQILADIYNEVLGEEESLTIRAIQRMEKHDKVPMDHKRRLLLATILNIPPAYFGLTNLTPYTLPADMVQGVLQPDKVIDIAGYRAQLSEYWIKWTTYNVQDVLTDILTRIYTLQETILYGKQSQRESIIFLLCQYLVLYGNIRRDQGYSDIAITYLDKAITLANEKGYSELAAKASYFKGYAQFDKWGIQFDRETNRLNLQLAANSFQAAWHFVEVERKAFNGPLRSAIIAEKGLVEAYQAQSASEKTIALKTIDQASTVLQRKDYQRDKHFVYVNDEWYHIDKAEGYVALGWGQSAIHELDAVDRSNPLTRRRYIYTDIVEADAYLAEDHLDMAIACAENALDLLAGQQLFIFITRIANIYRRLLADEKYMRSPDVARLGGKLLKVQHAALFRD
jgi:hypothetical protein